MAEEQKNTQQEFQGCCGGLPCGDMMRKMVETKKSGQGTTLPLRPTLIRSA